MNAQQILQAIENGELDDVLIRLYSADGLDYAKERCRTAVEGFTGRFGDSDRLHLFSSPGRVEIVGNHTDHNHGRVLAGAVNMDILAVACPTDEPVIRVKSVGHKQDDIDLTDLSPQSDESTHSASLIRGIASDFDRKGRKIGGFTAYTISDVPKGSGLSSSAAFEVLIGSILNHFYNDGMISPEEVAITAQFAENVYFGKPSGLMDQMACSVGNIVRIDFKDPSAPDIQPLCLSPEAAGHRLVIVSAGHGHADLTDEYAAIPAEMKAVAGLFGQPVLRGIGYEALMEKAAEIRQRCGDRALLRAMHFISENERVALAAKAVDDKDFASFLRQLNASGDSSLLCLQNISAASEPASQGITLALAVAKQLLDGKGACRVHGGGFGGTMLAIVPDELLEAFTGRMEQLFEKGCCHCMTFRPGAAKII